MKTNRQELTFDGCGINGPDEYRTRIATFTKIRGADAKKYGPLFAAAPELLSTLKRCRDLLLDSVNYNEGDKATTEAVSLADLAIAKAEWKSHD